MTMAEVSSPLSSLGLEVAIDSPWFGRVQFLNFEDVIANFKALRASAPRSRSGLTLELGSRDWPDVLAD